MMETILESANDPILQEDLEGLVRRSGAVPLECLKGKTVFVTGATGLIGASVAKALACCNRMLDAGIQVVAFARSQKKAERVFGELLKRPDVSLQLGDVCKEETIAYDGAVDYIIHGASATSSRYFVSHPAETIQTALDGTRNMLTFAKTKHVSGFLYLSSLEVYGTPPSDVGLLHESSGGYIDPLQVRSSYSEGKRMAECLCAAYASEYGIPVKVARLTQTFGAGVAYDDSRVFAEFARCALEHKDIVLHTPGRTVRSYCYTADAALALLFILLKGNVQEAYNTANMDTKISIADMAQLVCDAFPESGIHVAFDIPEDASSFGYNPEMVAALDSSKLMALGWKPAVGLKDMFLRMAKSTAFCKP